MQRNRRAAYAQKARDLSARNGVSGARVMARAIRPRRARAHHPYVMLREDDRDAMRACVMRRAREREVRDAA